MRVSNSWHTEPLLVIDTETTGTDPKTAEVVQLGGAFFVGGACVSTFGALVKPIVPIPAEASAIHNITDADVVRASDLKTVLHKMHSYFSAEYGAEFERKLYAAYNAPYDVEILQRCDVNNEFLPPQGAFSFVDPLVWVRQHDKFVRGKGRHTLSVSCERHGVKLDGAHDAKADAQATGRLLYKLLQKGAVPTGKPADFFDQQSRIRKRQDEEFQAWLAKQPKQELT